MKRSLHGYSIIEVLMVMAIVAILGSIAVVGYQEYTARAKASEVLLKYDELRTRTMSNLSQGTVDSCDRLATALNKSASVSHDHVALGFGFEAVAGGYRPVLTICGKADPDFPLAIKVARAAHDTMAKATDMVAPNPILTDSLVSFGLRLSDGERAVCKTAVTPPIDNCSASAIMLRPAPAQQPSSSVSAPAPLQVATAPTRSELPHSAFAGCPDGMVKSANGQCRALVCREEVIPAPPPALLSHSLSMNVDGSLVTNTYQGLPMPDVPSVPPQSARNGSSAPGSTCLLCGDLEGQSPCTELDIVLAVTTKCPDSSPVCGNTVQILNGAPAEYRRCLSIAKALTFAADRSECAEGTFNVKNTPGASCTATCYGDDCNLFDPGVSLVGRKRTICE